MADSIKTKERIYRPKSATYKQIYHNDTGVKIYINIIGGILPIIGLFMVMFTQDYSTYKLGLYFVFQGLVVTVLTYVIFINSDMLKKMSSLVANTKSSEYMLNLGVEVLEHLGDAILSIKNKDNLTGRFLLRDTEKVKRMMVVVGKAGSGKTVALRGYFEDILKIGCGCFVVDAKGTVDEVKRLTAMVYKYGREKDLFILNFANRNNTHTLNFLSRGTATMLKEIMMALSSSTDEKWRQVDEDFISSILKLLVYKRDNENLKLTLNTIRNYLTLNRIFKEAWKYRKIDDVYIEDFVRYVCAKIEIDYEEFIEVDSSNAEYYKKCEEQTKNTDLQGVYECGLSANNWNGVLTVLGSDYGQIFNVAEPDVDIYEAIMSNKIIIVSLPTMESAETSQKIGKLLLGIIKATAYEKITNTFEPKVPFVFLLDEFGSFAIKGFGNFMSKARSLGLPMFLFFQSTSQVDLVDDGKGLEKGEIFDNTDCFICLKNTDDTLAEYLNKTVPKEVFLDKSYKEVRKDVESKQDQAKEADYQKVEEDRLKSEYFARLNNGEMWAISGDEAFKAVANPPSDFNLTYKMKDISVDIPLLKVYPKDKLIKDLSGTRKNDIFRKDIVYNRYTKQVR